MSYNLDGQVCPVCHSEFKETDDTVYCPICGAPHHRDCYSRIGHCALEELHGTERQYDRAAVEKSIEDKKAAEPVREKPIVDAATGIVRCESCGQEYDPSAMACPKCGRPNPLSSNATGGFGGFHGINGFDFLGGVPADFPLDENVTAEDAQHFVMANTPRYIPKFAAMNAKNRASWNWIAFLFPCGWFLSRKMYKDGIFFGILTVAASLLMLPFSSQLYSLGLNNAVPYYQLIENIYESIPKIGVAIIVLAVVGLLAGLGLRIFAAITGDYYYRCYTVNSIKHIKAESDDVDDDFRRMGGVNFWAMLLGILAVEYLPGLIAMFI